MMTNLRNYLGSCLLGFLLLFVASRGMTLPRESNTVWQQGKGTSYEILRQLEKLDIPEPVAFETTVQFPQPIDCSDSCDPDSLATTNKMRCLTKISQGLHHYRNLLIMFSDGSDLTNELQQTLNSLLQLPLLKDGSNNERSRPVMRTSDPAWQRKLLGNLTLWRLQSFGVVVARVFSHCASLS